MLDDIEPITGVHIERPPQFSPEKKSNLIRRINNNSVIEMTKSQIEKPSPDEKLTSRASSVTRHPSILTNPILTTNNIE